MACNFVYCNFTYYQCKDEQHRTRNRTERRLMRGDNMTSREQQKEEEQRARALYAQKMKEM